MEFNESYLKNDLHFDSEKITRLLLMYDIAKKISCNDKHGLILKGGTSLLFCYGLDRFSTDLE